MFFYFSHFLFLAVLGLLSAHGLSPVAVRGECSLVAVHRLLIAAASLVAELRL